MSLRPPKAAQGGTETLLADPGDFPVRASQEERMEASPVRYGRLLTTILGHGRPVASLQRPFPVSKIPAMARSLRPGVGGGPSSLHWLRCTRHRHKCLSAASRCPLSADTFQKGERPRGALAAAAACVEFLLHTLPGRGRVSGALPAASQGGSGGAG